MLVPVPKLMRELKNPGEQAYLSRTDVEMELARLALAVMRASPHTFEELGARGAPVHTEDELPAEVASRLLMRTRPEHRPFVESRLMELARCLAGVRADGVHEWLSLGIDAQGAPRTPQPAQQVPERRTRR